jgi:Inner membrane protein YgaP-like, transmembrane domain
MDLNEGTLDRGLRVLVGLALIAFPLGIFGMDRAYVWGWIGLVPLVTGLVGWCPAYTLFGFKTCAR